MKELQISATTRLAIEDSTCRDDSFPTIRLRPFVPFRDSAISFMSLGSCSASWRDDVRSQLSRYLDRVDFEPRKIRGRAHTAYVRAQSSANELETGETCKPRALSTPELYRVAVAVCAD